MTPQTATAKRWPLVVTVMLTTVMVILDMTIVNVALPHMMGSLGATADQISWVLTSYIVAEAVFIPLTGFFSARLGRKRLMLTSVIGFVVSSALCGQADSLAQILIFRVLQGAFGASVIPLSQAIMADAFPGKERGKAMAFWGIGIMMGPILGPTLGGYITQHLDWRWVFYINVPVGLINLLMVARLLKPSGVQKVGADYLGALVMALGIGSLQVVLDRGNQENWFESHLIILLSVICLVSLLSFVLRSWQREDSLLKLRLLKDRNLALASSMMGLFGLGLFGTIALQPIMLEGLLGYSAQTAGLVMAPRGLGTAFSMLLMSRLILLIDSRLLLLTGLIIAAIGTYIMAHYNLQISPAWVIWPGVIQGIGMGMIFIPLSTLAYETIPKASMDQASGIFNLLRTIGSSVGISITSTVVSRATQSNWNELGAHIQPFNPALRAWLHQHALTLHDPLSAQLLAQTLYRQANMLAFNDAFLLMALSFIAMTPFLLLLRKNRQASQPLQTTA